MRRNSVKRHCVKRHSVKRHWAIKNSVSIDSFRSGRAYLPDSTGAAFFERQASDKPQGRKPPTASPSRIRQPNAAIAGLRSGKLPWRNAATPGTSGRGPDAAPAGLRASRACLATATGRPIRPRELTKAFSRLMASLGLSVRFHDLRHTHIFHLLAKGVHLKIVSERAGHASIGITLDTMYSHVVPGPTGSRRRPCGRGPAGCAKTLIDAAGCNWVANPLVFLRCSRGLPHSRNVTI